MNSRERVIAALDQKGPDRVPLDGSFRQDVWRKLEDHFGTKDGEIIREYLGLDFRYPMLEPANSFSERAVPAPIQIPEIGMGNENLVIIRDNDWLEDEYGICKKPSEDELYWQYTIHPLSEASVDDVKNYKFPDPGLTERYRNIRNDVDRFGKTHFIGVELWNIFKTSWEFRGWEQYLTDLYLQEELVEVLADRILEHRIEQSIYIAECGVDMIFIMGDIAMQNSMMLSPELWRKFFKPRLEKWIKEVRKDHDIYFMFHSDGDMGSVFSDLIEIGFDAIDPVQPECMDVEKYARKYGKKVCLHGTISLQETLPYGSTEDVANEVKERISCCGKSGGLVLAPANTVQPDVPIENILTLYETVRNFPLTKFYE